MLDADLEMAGLHRARALRSGRAFHQQSGVPRLVHRREVSNSRCGDNPCPAHPGN